MRLKQSQPITLKMSLKQLNKPKSSIMFYHINVTSAHWKKVFKSVKRAIITFSRDGFYWSTRFLMLWNKTFFKLIWWCFRKWPSFFMVTFGFFAFLISGKKMNIDDRKMFVNKGRLIPSGRLSNLCQSFVINYLYKKKSF